MKEITTRDNQIIDTKLAVRNLSVNANDVMAAIDAAWPLNEQGQQMPEAEVNKPGLVRSFRPALEDMAGATLPGLLPVKVLNAYVGARRQHDEADADVVAGAASANLRDQSPYDYLGVSLEVI